MTLICAACGATSLKIVPNYNRLRRVTSDCRPFAVGGDLRQCGRCGTVQKADTEQWRADCAAIYADYETYALSDGVEQAVRSGDGKEFGPRSEVVLRHLLSSTRMPARGRILDFGCGKGPTSRAASRVMPGWTIDGFDQDDRALAIVSAISGFGKLHTGDPSALPTGYDLIVLMHTLEHVPSPARMLGLLAGKLAPGGHILIQVPDREANPYDLLVADHLIHFDHASLGFMGTHAGLAPITLARDWVAKELTMLLAPSAPSAVSAPAGEDIAIGAQVDWLLNVADTVRKIGRERPLCIFGTALGGTWLAHELPALPDFFLDEDPARIGRSLDGVPVIAPSDAPRGATVVLALAPAIAKSVVTRLAPLGLDFVTLPAYPPA